MKNKISGLAKIAVLLFITSAFIFSSAFAEETKSGKKAPQTKSYNLGKVSGEGGKYGDSYRMFMNNIDLPINRKGVIADVEILNDAGILAAGGAFEGNTFLYSAGFLLGGLDTAGSIWANGVASASRIEDYIPGTWAGGQNDPRAVIYVLKKSDGPFHTSWDDWKDAVDLGAEFYDGDGDGLYNPVDKNGNGEWDVDEDRPDLIGDETVWCVYHDGLESALRRFSNVIPLGIEIRQTVFGFASKGSLGNILFVRYKLLNTGKVADVLDSVYFSVWADPDVGDYENDLVGSDVNLDAGFVYDKGVDKVYKNSPCFLIDFFQGPIAYVPGETFVDVDLDGIYTDGVDTPLDTAYEVKGQVRGVFEYPGGRNQGLSSFMHYIQSHPTLGDPNTEVEAYNYLRALQKEGQIVDPCTWALGEVRGGVDCNQVDPFFWYSGDPVADVGWICIIEIDQRQMSNTGPFQLKKGEPIEVVAAYVVGRASTSLASVNEAKKIDGFAQFIYDGNFNTAPPPPVVTPIIKTDESSIELIWETANSLAFNDVAYDETGNLVWDVRFEGFEVLMYNSATTAEKENGLENIKKIAVYDVANGIGNIIVEDGGTGERKTLYPKGEQLDPVIYGDPLTGRIRLVITQDPFTNTPLIQGKSYSIAISSYAINHAVIEKLNPNLETDDKYLIPGTAFISTTATIPKIFGGADGIVPGENLLAPYRSGVALAHTGPSKALANYSVFDRTKVKEDNYELSFIKDSLAAKYNIMWKVTNKTTNQVVLDSISVFNQTTPYYLADGVMLNVEWIAPKLENAVIGADWIKAQNSATGPLYLGTDVDSAQYASFVGTKQSSVIKADRRRQVELRFDQISKAYRYVRAATSTRFLYPDPNSGLEGFVDVPFQAWVKDSQYGEEYQLAVGFIENALKMTPDGKWNPYDSLFESNEYIIIFDSPYDQTGSNFVYTGTFTGSGTSKFADIGNGYKINKNDPNFTVTPEMEAIAKSPWFNAMYVVGLENIDSTDAFTPTGKYTIKPNYPLTVEDKFTYKPLLNLSATEKEDMFDKVNVYPNPLFGFNPMTGYSATGGRPDEPFVTFINLPEVVTVKIFTLSGILVRTLTEADKPAMSPTMRWDLQNEDRLRVASGMYLAVVNSPGLGDKVLKFSVILPQKQIQRF
ncbi:MAG: hypothetical protein KKD86_01785 [Bacteroidetes bacterium]|nr:hypothetical protein [Bacteroidota bacterium]MBU1677578.1 hypothetical protein [Bacteroidota bacterium]